MAMVMTPMAVVPIVPMPMAMMPTPMMPVVMMPAAVVVPTHLLRLDPIDLVLRYESGLRTAARVNRRRCGVHRRYRGGLRGCPKQRGDRNNSKTEFQQKVPAFHHLDPFSVRKRTSQFEDECSLNLTSMSSSNSEERSMWPAICDEEVTATGELPN
jgi:hypothetical protein